MRTLMLMRHARSSGDQPGFDDVDRPLAPHGHDKFPTAALAVIEFDLDSWSEVAPGAGRLRAFVRPKDLE